MSAAAIIRKLLEDQLATVTPNLATENENVKYTPVAGTPYQQIFLTFADPVNPELNGPLSIEGGVFYIHLKFPLNAGTGAAAAQAELIRSAFSWRQQFTNGNVTVTVIRKPTIAPGARDGDRWVVPVKVFFNANVS